MKEKRKKKWMGSIILLAGIVVTLFSTEEVRAASKKPELSKKRLNLVVGKQKKLSVKKQKGYTISWKSSKKAVATVSKTGKVKAKKKGNTKITAMMQSAKGDSSYRLICKVTVKQVKKQENSTAKSTDREKNTERNSSDRTPGTPMPAEQRQSGQPESNQGSAGQFGSNGETSERPGVSEQPESNQGSAGQFGSNGETSERPGVSGQPESNQGAAGQTGSAGQMPDQSFIDEPAASTTGSAITDGKAKLLFGNYDDGLWNGNFFGNRMIASYEQLQDLIAEIQTEMSGYENWKPGYDKLQWYINQLAGIGQDYFADHVLYIHTMSVARGYDYSLDSASSVMSESGKKELYLSLKRYYNLKKDECVTCDMPYYSFFIQVPRELAQGCESIICSLVSDEGVIPSDDLDDPYVIQDIL